MYSLVSPGEKRLFTFNFIVSTIFWSILVVCSFYSGGISFLGIFVLLSVFFYISYLFAQSAFIARIKGDAVLVSEKQFPEVYRQYNECCDKLDFKTRPKLYILQSNDTVIVVNTKFLLS